MSTLHSDMLSTTHGIELSASVLFIYDYIITFDQELEVVWRRKTTWSSVLYLLNRYCVIPYLVTQVPFMQDTHCKVRAVSTAFYNYLTL